MEISTQVRVDIKVQVDFVGKADTISLLLTPKDTTRFAFTGEDTTVLGLISNSYLLLQLPKLRHSSCQNSVAIWACMDCILASLNTERI